MIKSLVGALGALALLASCRSGKVELEYRFDPDHRARYLWNINAVTVTDSPAEFKTEKVELVAELDERIEQDVSSGKRILILRAIPLRVTEDGHRGAAPEPSEIKLELGPEGSVTKVYEADIGTGELVALELDNLATEARPPLARGPVAIADKWSANLRLDGQRSSLNLKGTGELSGFALEDGRKLARIEANRKGSIRSTQGSGTEARELSGTTRHRSHIKLDVGKGTLFSSNYRSFSSFDLTLGGSPAGTLAIKLHSTLKLV